MQRFPHLACVFSACWLFAATLPGCSYYKITDPQTGRTFYAQDNPIMGVPRVLRHGGSGAVEFQDLETGSVVTLQNSEVRQISKDEATMQVGKQLP